MDDAPAALRKYQDDLHLCSTSFRTFTVRFRDQRWPAWSFLGQNTRSLRGDKLVTVIQIFPKHYLLHCSDYEDSPFLESQRHSRVLQFAQLPAMRLESEASLWTALLSFDAWLQAESGTAEAAPDYDILNMQYEGPVASFDEE